MPISTIVYYAFNVQPTKSKTVLLSNDYVCLIHEELLNEKHLYKIGGLSIRYCMSLQLLLRSVIVRQREVF